MCHLSVLGFLPAGEMPGPFHELKLHLPEAAGGVTGWIRNNYVHHMKRRHLHNAAAACYQYCPPCSCPYMRYMWHGFLILETTQKMGKHNTVFSCQSILNHREFQKEQCHVENECEYILRGEPCPKRKRKREKPSLFIFSHYFKIRLMVVKASQPCGLLLCNSSYLFL
jgi:hypothetical protein